MTNGVQSPAETQVHCFLRCPCCSGSTDSTHGRAFYLISICCTRPGLIPCQILQMHVFSCVTIDPSVLTDTTEFESAQYFAMATLKVAWRQLHPGERRDVSPPVGSSV